MVKWEVPQFRFLYSRLKNMTPPEGDIAAHCHRWGHHSFENSDYSHHLFCRWCYTPNPKAPEELKVAALLRGEVKL